MISAVSYMNARSSLLPNAASPLRIPPSLPAFFWVVPCRRSIVARFACVCAPVWPNSNRMHLQQYLTHGLCAVLSLTMTIRASSLTPEVMLSAPRRSNGVPNDGGSLVLYTVSTYDFEAHKRTAEVRVLDVEKNESTVVTTAAGASEPHWLDGTNILLLQPGDEGQTNVLVGDVYSFATR